MLEIKEQSSISQCRQVIKHRESYFNNQVLLELNGRTSKVLLICYWKVMSFTSYNLFQVSPSEKKKKKKVIKFVSKSADFCCGSQYFHYVLIYVLIMYFNLRLIGCTLLIIKIVYVFPLVCRGSDNIYPALWHLNKPPRYKQNQDERGCKNADDKIPGLSIKKVERTNKLTLSESRNSC